MTPEWRKNVNGTWQGWWRGHPSAVTDARYKAVFWPPLCRCYVTLPGLAEPLGNVSAVKTGSVAKLLTKKTPEMWVTPEVTRRGRIHHDLFRVSHASFICRGTAQTFKTCIARSLYSHCNFRELELTAMFASVPTRMCGHLGCRLLRMRPVNKSFLLCLWPGALVAKLAI